MVHGGMPELFLGLAYNSSTGRLSVQVIKGSNFKNLAMSRAPGTVKLLALLLSYLSCHSSSQLVIPTNFSFNTLVFSVALRL